MNWKAATSLFFLGYVIASIVGYVLYRLSSVAMWVGMFTLMSVVFAYLTYVYFSKYVKEPPGVNVIKLTAYWVILSFVLDGLIYVLLLPITFGAKPNWLFFITQSPWIWLAYVALAVTVAIGFIASRVLAQPSTENRQVQRNASR